MFNIFKDKEEETIWIRGVCASIQSMAMPTLNNLVKLFDKAGYVITITKKPTNTPQNEKDKNPIIIHDAKRH